MKHLLPLLPFLAFSGIPLLQAQETDFEGVVLYEHGAYGGSTLTLYPGEGIAYLSEYWENDWETWNDQVSSVAVWGNVVVYLYADVNYQGAVLELRDHADYLSAFDWNDRVSSVWVEYAEPEGWYWDPTFDNWIWREADGWLYHYQGLGWIYGGYYDSLLYEGWFWDSAIGWLWTDPTLAPWFVAADGILYFHEPGTSDPRWWYSNRDGWFTG